VNADTLTIDGLRDNIDLSNYNTLSIPATYTDSNNNTYRVTSIKSGAFFGEFNASAYNSIINLNLNKASNLQDIGINAFMNCSGLTGLLIIPSSVTNIGVNAFGRTKFIDVVNYSLSFTFADNVGDAKVLISTASGTSLDYENESVIGCIACGQLTIPDSVTSIGVDIFKECSGLTGSLTIPDSVVSVGRQAFEECSGLTGSLIIPDSVTSIGLDAFGECSGFTGSLIIPDSVTSIGTGAFEMCSGFNTINVVDWTDVPTIGNDAFIGFNTTPGKVIVPTSLGITISTFPGLPSS
jgi:hypothetical protein